MLRRRVLLLAGLMALLVAPASAAALGPAVFVRATGGTYTAALHPGGISVYSKSPAYLVLRGGPSTTTLERDASNHNYPWVAVADTRGGRAGMDCFGNGHLVTARSRVDVFTESRHKYNGLFLQYSNWHFKAGARKPAGCAPARGGAAVVPSITQSGKSVNLHLDCLVRNCTGTLIAYGQPGLCSHPTTATPGHVGCQPFINGRFAMSGGLSVNLSLPLSGRSPRLVLMAITVNGQDGPVVRLGSLPQAFRTPSKPQRASLSITCPTSATVGTPVPLSGTLTPAGPGAPLTLTFSGAGGKPQRITVTTAPSGTFSSQFTPSSRVAWVVDASFAGDRTRTHAERACGFRAT